MSIPVPEAAGIPVGEEPTALGAGAEPVGLGRESLGLRERKRAQSRHAIERAALAAVLEHGYEHVSVEQIAERAGVSPRTFFNYFGTKDAALIASALPEPSADDLALLAAGRGDDLFGEVLELFARLRSLAPMDAELTRQRKAILRETPALVQAMFTRIHTLEHGVAEAVRERMTLRHPEATAQQVEGEITVLVQVATSLLRYATQQILIHGRSDTELLEIMREGRRMLGAVVAEPPA